MLASALDVRVEARRSPFFQDTVVTARARIPGSRLTVRRGPTGAPLAFPAEEALPLAIRFRGRLPIPRSMTVTGGVVEHRRIGAATDARLADAAGFAEAVAHALHVAHEEIPALLLRGVTGPFPLALRACCLERLIEEHRERSETVAACEIAIEAELELFVLAAEALACRLDDATLARALRSPAMPAASRRRLATRLAGVPGRLTIVRPAEGAGRLSLTSVAK